mmetsp:Transcript_142268/g.454787  ORF Transcript_142268/g.454787 Transcript_142268/m.454787 type:complete len:704 (-) Transcript_142268:140-2251(-)
MAEHSFDVVLQQTSSAAEVVVPPSTDRPPTSSPSAASAEDAKVGLAPASTAHDAPGPTSAVAAIGAAPSPDRPPTSSFGGALAEDATRPAHDTPQQTGAAVVVAPSSDRQPTHDQQSSSVAAVVVAPSPDQPPISSPSAAGAENASTVFLAAMPPHHAPQQTSTGVVVAPSPVGPPTPSPSAASDGSAVGECAICLECHRPEEYDSWVTLQCGHAFHAGTCLAGHIRVQCLLVERRVQENLRESFDALGLETGMRRAVLGRGDLVNLHQQERLRQCPQCRYGPVVNTNCFDMASHDSERGSGTGRTTNKCPNCEFFSTRYEDWNVWKPDDVTAAVLCPLCRSRCEVSNSDRTRILERFATVDGRLEARSQMNLRSGLLHMLCTILRKLQLGIAVHGDDPDGASSDDVPNRGDQAVRRHRLGPESRRRARRATSDEFQFLERLGDTPVATKRRAFTPVLEHLERELLRQRGQADGGQAEGRRAKLLCFPCWQSETVGSQARQRVEADGRPCVQCRQLGFQGLWVAVQAADALPAPDEAQERTDQQRMEDLLREVLAARPVLEGGDAPPAEGLTETWEHREQLALLLYTVKDGLGPEVERKLGKPWRPDDLTRRQCGNHLPENRYLENLRMLVNLRHDDMNLRGSVFRELQLLSAVLGGSTLLRRRVTQLRASSGSPRTLEALTTRIVAMDIMKSLLRKVLEDAE